MADSLLKATGRAGQICGEPLSREELLKAAQDRDQLLEALRRARADFENYQKRVQRDHEEDRRYLHAPFALDLLSVLDDLARATDAAQRAGDTGPLAQGVELVRKVFLDVLRRHGIHPIDALGEKFDPTLHHAVMAIDAEPAGTIVEVIKEGYRIHDRLLRPAEVAVARPPVLQPL